MKHSKSDNYYISPLTNKKIVIPKKQENETYTQTSYRKMLEGAKNTADTGVAIFCGGQNSTLTKSHKLSMDF
ncbi:MAG: hypothetical protein JJW00_07060 [Sulfurimonas sp.]|nr:hypothetical protein [Sulfurimonas sp.]